MPFVEVLDLDRLRRVVPAAATDAELTEYATRNMYVDVRTWNTSEKLDRYRYDYPGITADSWETAINAALAGSAGSEDDAGPVQSKTTNGQSVSYGNRRTRADYRMDEIRLARQQTRYWRSRTRSKSVLVTERAIRRFWDDDIIIPTLPDNPGAWITLAEVQAMFAEHDTEGNPHTQYELVADSPQVEFIQVAPSTHWGPIDWPYAEDPDAVVFDSTGVDVTARGVIVTRSGSSVFVDTTIPLAGKIYLRG